MIKFSEDRLSVAEYLSLREAVGWKKLSERQAELALENCLYCISAYDDDKLIGMGRIVGDGAVICYIQDLNMHGQVFAKGFQLRLFVYRMQILLLIFHYLLIFVFDLMCAKGREMFYEKHGFIARPTDALGPGMIQYIRK